MDVTKARPHALPLGLLLKKLVFFLLILGSCCPENINKILYVGPLDIRWNPIINKIISDLMGLETDSHKDTTP